MSRRGSALVQGVRLLLVLWLWAAVGVGAPVAQAQEDADAGAAPVRFEDLPDAKVYGDFVVGPGKVELEMRPGETRTVEIRVSNRMGEARTFSLGVEDFGGSQDVRQPVVLYGTQRGPYSLRDYLFPAVREIEIAHGRRAVIPVTVAIPEDAEPGGKYGSVLISVAPKPAQNASGGGAAAGTTVISRIGVLFFIKVPGEVREEGRLTDFRVKDGAALFQKGPIPFELYFENTGNVHLNPYGFIQVENMAGQVVGEQEIEPWFTLPGSRRVREVSWDRPLLIGKYTARLSLNRGYGNEVDTAQVSFWVIPYALIAGVLAALLVFFFLFRLVLVAARKRHNTANHDTFS